MGYNGAASNAMAPVTFPSRSTLLDACTAFADEAAVEIMRIYAGDLGTRTKADSSPVTDADQAAETIILRGLRALTPGTPVVAEEEMAGGHKPVLDGGPFWLVDPLDGTKEFIKRNGEFTVNIALVAQGEPVAAVVLAPALGELFFGARGLGVWKQDASGKHAIHCAPQVTGQPLRVIGSRSHGGEQLTAWLASLAQEYSFVAAGSSLKFCRIAEGQADIYPRFGPTCQWDTAAAQCILELAGGVVTDMAGQRLRYGAERALLNPEFVAAASISQPVPEIKI